MAPPRKKTKLTNPSLNGASDREPSDSESPGDSAPAASRPPPAEPEHEVKIDKSNWKGFSVIESEPAFLNYILKEWGVRDVKAREIIDVDQILDEQRPIYGIIYCSEYKKSDDHEEEQCPENVWFANQTSHNSCLSVAMINILNNAVGLDLGDNLQKFKDDTKKSTPFARGVKLADFEFLRRIHNSFATEMDMLNADLMLKGDYETAQKGKAKAAKAKSKAKSKSKAGANKQKGSSATPKKRKRRGHDANASFHYQAFVPVDNEVWMLDGMDRQPTNLGSFEGSDDWTTWFLPKFRQIVKQGYGEPNIMCLCRDPAIDARAELAKNIATIAAIEQELTVRDPDWRADEDTLTGPSEEFGIDADAIGTAVVDAKIQDQIASYDFGDLFDLRNNVLARKQGPLRQNLEDLAEKEAKELLTAEEAMIDFGPFIRRWLLELGKASKLKELIKKVELINKAARSKR